MLLPAKGLLPGRLHRSDADANSHQHANEHPDEYADEHRHQYANGDPDEYTDGYANEHRNPDTDSRVPNQ